MAWIDIEDIVDVELMFASTFGEGISPAEKVEIDTRLDALEGQSLTDLMDQAPADGDVPTYDASSGSWTPEQVVAGISRVWNGSTYIGPFTRMSFADGLEFFTDPQQPDLLFARVAFGSGQNQAARGDHVHPVPAEERFSLANPGSIPTISSGTRDLVTANVGTFAVGVPTLVEVQGFVHGEGIIDPAIMDIYIDIDGTRYSSADIHDTQPLTWEQGVNAQNWWRASAVITRAASGTTAQTAASRQVRLGVSWQGWGGLKVASAAMWVKRTAYRT